jgi:hypothetical protein
LCERGGCTRNEVMYGLMKQKEVSTHEEENEKEAPRDSMKV